MEATLIISNKGLENKGEVAGVIATVEEQHTLYYDSGVGLYYRIDNKVETIATKVNESDFNRIKEEMTNLRDSFEKAVAFNLEFAERQVV
ncbi:hypothetical protein QI339_12170 [Staphylococcus saprophyticus]|nr:hypothetical protein [Staphylococcus saprophyticus]